MPRITPLFIALILFVPTSLQAGTDPSAHKQIGELRQKLAKAQLEISDLKKRMAALEAKSTNDVKAANGVKTITAKVTAPNGSIGFRDIAMAIPTTYLPKVGIRDWDPIKHTLFSKQMAEKVGPQLRGKTVTLDVELISKSLDSRLNLTFRPVGFHESKSLVYVLGDNFLVHLDTKYAEQFIKPRSKRFKLSLVIEGAAANWRRQVGYGLPGIVPAAIRRKPMLKIILAFKDPKLIGYTSKGDS